MTIHHPQFVLHQGDCAQVPARCLWAVQNRDAQEQLAL